MFCQLAWEAYYPGVRHTLPKGRENRQGRQSIKKGDTSCFKCRRHQIEESLSFSPAECFSSCPSSAAPFHMCLFLREQLPQKSVGVIHILKLNLCLTTSLKSALFWWWGKRAPYTLYKKNSWSTRKRSGGTNILCHWDFWHSVARPSNSPHPPQLSTEPPAPSVPSTDTPSIDLQNLGMSTQQNYLNADTHTPRLNHLWICSLSATWSLMILNTCNKLSAWSLHTTILMNKTCSTLPNCRKAK